MNEPRRMSGLEHLRANSSAKVNAHADQLRLLEEFHLVTEKDDEFNTELDQMIAHILSESADEGYAIAVVGKSGAGKSTLVRHRLRTHKAFESRLDDYGNRKQLCLWVKTPPACTMRSLGEAILRNAGYPLAKRLTETETWLRVRDWLILKEYRIIFLDEFQHVLKAPTIKGVAHTSDTVKSLMQDTTWPVWLILSGIPDMLNFIEADPDGQSARRTRVITFDDLNDDDVNKIASVAKKLANIVGFEIGFVMNRDFVRRLMHGGIWRTGMTIQLIKLSIQRALWNDKASKEKKVNHEHFVQGYKLLCNCDEDSNVFLAADWHEIYREVSEDGKLTSTYTKPGKK